MKTSKALLEVWEMKEAAYKETKHLKGASFFSYIRDQIAKSLPGTDALPKLFFTSSSPAANSSCGRKT